MSRPRRNSYAAPDDIRKVAELIAKARNPVVLTEAVGRDAEAFHALVALSDKASLPVVERPGAIFANFPKDHPMHQGHDFNRFWGDTDLAIVISTRTPWYPPSKRPPNAIVVDIDEVPHRPYMAYQSHQADIYLEGDTTSVLTDLTKALDAVGLDQSRLAERRARLTGFPR